MKILYSWLKDYVRLRESPKKLAELLSSKSFETAVISVFGKDAVLDAALLPNRVADSSGHYGIARELGLLLGRKVSEVTFEDLEVSSKGFPVRVDVPALCPRYSAIRIDGIRVGRSPKWMVNRLRKCGLRSINNVVDVTNYVMLELGQPMHAFDCAKIKGGIIVRRAKKGEHINALDEKRYVLDSRDLVIADDEGVLAIAGIKGGKKAEISARTKDIILESANFDRLTVRETSKRLGLKTDSSWRFEHGLDPNLTVKAIERAVYLLRKVAAGKAVGKIADVYVKQSLPRPIVLDLKWLGKFLGKEFKLSEILRYLKPILTEIKPAGSDRFILKIATWRPDILEREDLAEELARLYGYDRLPASEPAGLLIPPRRNEMRIFKQKLRSILSGLGYAETYLHSFISEDDVKKFAFAPEMLVEIRNPISAAYAYLRPTMLVNLLKAASGNLRFFERCDLYEIGKVFVRSGARIREAEYVAGISIDKRSRGAHDLLLAAKGAVEHLLESLGLDADDYHFDTASAPGLSGSATMTVVVDSTVLGTIGAVDLPLAINYGIDLPSAYWELDLKTLFKSSSEEHEFEPPHKYPDVIRDISIFVPLGTRVEEVEGVIFGSGAKYLEDIDLFDIYEGDGLPEDKTSMAFHCIFRHNNRTLTDEEVGKDMEKILDALRKFGAEIR